MRKIVLLVVVVIGLLAGSLVGQGATPLSATPACSTKAYVTNNGSPTVSVIDVASGVVGSTISVGANPYGVAITPDGTKAYVVNNGWQHGVGN